MKPGLIGMAQKPNSSRFGGSSSCAYLKKGRHDRSNIRGILMVFFEFEVIVHQKFVPPGPAVNQHSYQDIL
jgi:hypothetical protein